MPYDLTVVMKKNDISGKRIGCDWKLKFLAIAIAIIMTTVSLIAATSTTPIEPNAPVVPIRDSALSAAETTLLGTRNLTYVWDNVSYLSDGLQEKIVGSVEEWKAQQYVYNALNNLSLDKVEWLPFNTSSWNHTGDKMTVVAGSVNIPCTIYGFSYGVWGYEGGVYYSFGNLVGGTVLQALLVDAGYGSKADFDALGADLHGAIALVHRDDDSQGWTTVLNYEADRHNASATISYDYMASGSSFSNGIKQDDIGGYIPFFSISIDSATYLKGLLSGGPVTLRLEGRADFIAYGVLQSSNVAGYLYGSKYPDEYVVISSHIDTFWNGTWDTIGGIGCMMEFARIFSEAKAAGTFTNERTLVFVSCGAEEAGGPDTTWFSWLVGSYEFTRAHPEIVNGTVMELNMDGVGLAKTTGQYWGEVTPDMTDFFNQVTTDLGHTGSVGVYHPLWSWTDAWTYGAKVGTSVCQLWYPLNYYTIYHTQDDNMGLYSNESIDLTLEFYTVMAARASTALIYPVNLIATLDWITSGSGNTWPGGLTIDRGEVPYKAPWFDNCSAALAVLRGNVTRMNTYAANLQANYSAAGTPAERAAIEWNATWLNNAIREAERWINRWATGEGGVMSSWDSMVRPDQHSRDISYIDVAIEKFGKGTGAAKTQGLTALTNVFSMQWGKLYSNWTYHEEYYWINNTDRYWGGLWDQQQDYVDVWWIWNGVTNGTVSEARAITALTAVRDNLLLPWLHKDLLVMENAFENASAEIGSGMSPPVVPIPEPTVLFMVGFIAMVILISQRRKKRETG